MFKASFRAVALFLEGKLQLLRECDEVRESLKSAKRYSKLAMESQSRAARERKDMEVQRNKAMEERGIDVEKNFKLTLALQEMEKNFPEAVSVGSQVETIRLKSLS